jgi:hypothetical protein
VFWHQNTTGDVRLVYVDDALVLPESWTLRHAEAIGGEARSDNGDRWISGERYDPEFGSYVEPEAVQLIPNPMTGTSGPINAVLVDRPNMVEGFTQVVECTGVSNDYLGWAPTTYAPVVGEPMTCVYLAEAPPELWNDPDFYFGFDVRPGNIGGGESYRIRVWPATGRVANSVVNGTNVWYRVRWLGNNKLYVALGAETHAGVAGTVAIARMYGFYPTDLAKPLKFWVHCGNIVANTNRPYQPIPEQATRPLDGIISLTKTQSDWNEVEGSALALVDYNQTHTNLLGQRAGYYGALGKDALIGRWQTRDNASNQQLVDLSSDATPQTGYLTYITGQAESYLSAVIPGSAVVTGGPKNFTGPWTHDPDAAIRLNQQIATLPTVRSYGIWRNLAWWDVPNTIDFDAEFGPGNYKGLPLPAQTLPSIQNIEWEITNWTIKAIVTCTAPARVTVQIDPDGEIQDSGAEVLTYEAAFVGLPPEYPHRLIISVPEDTVESWQTTTAADAHMFVDADDIDALQPTRAPGDVYGWDGEKYAVTSDVLKPVSVGVKQGPYVWVGGHKLYIPVPAYTNGEACVQGDVRWHQNTDGDTRIIQMTNASGTCGQTWELIHETEGNTALDGQGNTWISGPVYEPWLGIYHTPDLVQLLDDTTIGQSGTAPLEDNYVPSLIEGQPPVQIIATNGGYQYRQFQALATPGENNPVVHTAIIELIGSADQHIRIQGYEGGTLIYNFQVQTGTGEEIVHIAAPNGWRYSVRWLAPNVLKFFGTYITDLTESISYRIRIGSEADPNVRIACHCVNLAVGDFDFEPIPEAATKPTDGRTYINGTDIATDWDQGGMEVEGTFVVGFGMGRNDLGYSPGTNNIIFSVRSSNHHLGYRSPTFPTWYMSDGTNGCHSDSPTVPTRDPDNNQTVTCQWNTPLNSQQVYRAAELVTPPTSEGTDFKEAADDFATGRYRYIARTVGNETPYSFRYMLIANKDYRQIDPQWFDKIFGPSIYNDPDLLLSEEEDE